MNLRHIKLFEKSIEDRIQRRENLKNIKNIVDMSFVYPISKLSSNDQHQMFIWIAKYYHGRIIEYKKRNNLYRIVNVFHEREKVSRKSEELLAISSLDKSELTLKRLDFLIHNISFKIESYTNSWEVPLIVRRKDFMMQPHQHGEFIVCFIDELINIAQKQINLEEII